VALWSLNFRHVLAAVHFNCNLRRDTKKKADGSEQLRVVYPKFKNGEASVRGVRIEQNFDYVEEFYQTYVEAEREKMLDAAAKELQERSPPPMNSMLEKEERQVAVERREARQKMTVADVPPTTPLSVVLAQEASVAHAQSSNTGRTRTCTVCKRPMRGHNLLLVTTLMHGIALYGILEVRNKLKDVNKWLTKTRCRNMPGCL